MNAAAAAPAPAFSLISLVSTVAALGVLVCFILVMVKMFQNKDTVGGVVSIITLLICCIGLLFNVNFILGWTKADRWNMKKLMYTYTGFYAVYLITTVLTIPQQITMIQEQMKMIQQQQQQQQQPQPTPAPAPEQPALAPQPEGAGEPAQAPNN